MALKRLQESPAQDSYVVEEAKKIPARAIESVGSGFGIGNILDVFNRNIPVTKYLTNPLQIPAQLGLSALQYLDPKNAQQIEKIREQVPTRFIPTTGEVRQQLGRVLPEQYVQEGGLLSDVIGGYGIPFVATGGLSGFAQGATAGLGQASKTIGQLAGMHLGSLAGQKAAQGLGGIASGLGAEQIGQALGGEVGQTVGGLAGAIGIPALVKKGLPSNYLKEEIYKKNVSEFEANKLKQLAELQKEYEPKIAEQRQAIGQIAGESKPLQTYYDQKRNFENYQQEQLAKLKKDYAQQTEKLKAQRRYQKQQLIKQAEQRKARIAELDKKRNPLYTEAKQESVSLGYPSAKLQSFLGTLENEIKGLEKSDQKRILDVAKQISDSMPEGELPLSEAIKIKQNINMTLSNRNAYDPLKPAPAVVNYLKRINNALNDYIGVIAEEQPQFGKPYTQAEQATQEYKRLIKEQKLFERNQKLQETEINRNFKDLLKEAEASYKEAASFINREKFPTQAEFYINNPIKVLEKELGLTEKEYMQARDAIQKSTYDDIAQNKMRQQEIIDGVKDIGQKASRWELANILGGLLKFFGADKQAATLINGVLRLAAPVAQEVQEVLKLMKAHPEIAQKYGQELAQESLKNIPGLLGIAQQMGQDTQQLELIPKRQEKKGKLIRVK